MSDSDFYESRHLDQSPRARVGLHTEPAYWLGNRGDWVSTGQLGPKAIVWVSLSRGIRVSVNNALAVELRGPGHARWLGNRLIEAAAIYEQLTTAAADPKLEEDPGPHRLLSLPERPDLADGLRWWRCRWCGRGEILPGAVSVHVEKQRCLDHERDCVDRVRLDES